MTKAEIFEEIRALLREPQMATLEEPYTYDDPELVVQVRSALRHLRSIGIPVKAAMSDDGVLSPEPTETQGVLLALYIASNLLSGDLVRKLSEGDLGVYFRVGSDVIDMKTATVSFKDSAKAYRLRYETLLTIALTDTVNAAASVFGGPGNSFS